MSFIVRKARIEDVGAIAKNNIATALETEKKSLDNEVVRRGVLAVMEDPTKGFYLIAEKAGEVVGQCLITFEWSDWRCGSFWWIQSLYVHPDHRNEGIFLKLFDDILDRIQETNGVAGIRLYVDESNHIAMKAYERAGMRRSHYVMFGIDQRDQSISRIK